MIKWSNYFDQIICVHYLPLSERLSRITEQLDYCGILTSGIFRFDESIDSIFYKNLWNTIYFHKRCEYGRNQSQYGQFKCSYQHYEIYKKCLAHNYSRVLILEDDVVFLKNLDVIQTIIQQIPDYDIILFDKIPDVPYQLFINDQKYPLINNFYREFNQNCLLFSSACYSLTSKALKNFSLSQEKEFCPSDLIWNISNEYIDDLSKCYSTINIAKQMPTEHNNTSANYVNDRYFQINVKNDDYHI